ncbi:MAG: hypothetical protein LBI02_03840, partial [Opitutaceae bacterium]|nr:hypothetical protein [Opitutaceae bacterium]
MPTAPARDAAIAASNSRRFSASQPGNNNSMRCSKICRPNASRERVSSAISTSTNAADARNAPANASTAPANASAAPAPAPLPDACNTPASVPLPDARNALAPAPPSAARNAPAPAPRPDACNTPASVPLPAARNAPAPAPPSGARNANNATRACFSFASERTTASSAARSPPGTKSRRSCEIFREKSSDHSHAAPKTAPVRSRARASHFCFRGFIAVRFKAVSLHLSSFLFIFIFPLYVHLSSLSPSSIFI